MIRTVIPIVTPAHNYVAPAYGMAVIAEIPALKFKFDLHALPSFGSDLTHGFAVGESLLNCFDPVAQIIGKHSKKQDDALFVHRFMAQPKEIRGIAVRSPALQQWVL